MRHPIEDVMAYFPHVEDDSVCDLDYDESRHVMRVLVDIDLTQYEESDLKALGKVYGPFKSYPEADSLFVKLTFYDVKPTSDAFMAAIQELRKFGLGNPIYDVSLASESVTLMLGPMVGPKVENLTFFSSGFDYVPAKQRVLRKHHRLPKH